MVAIGLAIFVKILFISLNEGEVRKGIDKGQNFREEIIKAKRGNIYSDNESILATTINSPWYEVRWDMKMVEENLFKEKYDSLARCFANYFEDKSYKEYKQFFKNKKKSLKNRDVLLKKKISEEQLNVIKTFPILNKGKKVGLKIINTQYREKQFKQLAARTIGFTRSEDKNKKTTYVGLEGFYESYLRGINGRRKLRKTAQGFVPVSDINMIEPQNGNDIYTTIDIELQEVVENALKNKLDTNDAEHGCAIVMEVKTGYVKAIANLKKNKNGEYDELYNFALGEADDPGSTFKLASIIAALEDKKVDVNDSLNITGGKTLFCNRKMEDSHTGLHNWISVKKIFEISSNVGISKLIYNSYKNEPQKYIDRLYSFNLNKPLNMDVIGESKPYIKNTKSKTWSCMSLPWMSIGYEMRITPMQILNLYNTIANNGKMMKPIFVTEIRSNGKVEKSFTPIVIKDSICSQITVKKVKILLEGVIEDGTAKNIKNPQYKIAGKTGTAQIANTNQGYGEDGNRSYKASFVGYFPADNPKYSIIVVINKPRKGYIYGSELAAPVFKEISDYIYSKHIASIKDGAIINFTNYINESDKLLIFQSDYYQIIKNSNFRKSANKNHEDYLSKILNTSKSQKTVPNIVGIKVKDALYILEELGLNVKIIGKGIVKKQSIEPNVKLKKYKEITIECKI